MKKEKVTIYSNYGIMHNKTIKTKATIIKDIVYINNSDSKKCEHYFGVCSDYLRCKEYNMMIVCI